MLFRSDRLAGLEGPYLFSSGRSFGVRRLSQHSHSADCNAPGFQKLTSVKRKVTHRWPPRVDVPGELRADRHLLISSLTGQQLRPSVCFILSVSLFRLWSTGGRPKPGYSVRPLSSVLYCDIRTLTEMDLTNICRWCVLYQSFLESIKLTLNSDKQARFV